MFYIVQFTDEFDNQNDGVVVYQQCQKGPLYVLKVPFSVRQTAFMFVD